MTIVLSAYTIAAIILGACITLVFASVNLLVTIVALVGVAIAGLAVAAYYNTLKERLLQSQS